MSTAVERERQRIGGHVANPAHRGHAAEVERGACELCDRREILSLHDEAVRLLEEGAGVILMTTRASDLTKGHLGRVRAFLAKAGRS